MRKLSHLCAVCVLGALALESDMLNFCFWPGPAAASKKRRER
jgi:hypothetical protein